MDPTVHLHTELHVPVLVSVKFQAHAAQSGAKCGFPQESCTVEKRGKRKSLTCKFTLDYKVQETLLLHFLLFQRTVKSKWNTVARGERVGVCAVPGACVCLRCRCVWQQNKAMNMAGWWGER